MSDRKYRQRGYQDSREQTQPKTSGDKPQRKGNSFGPRAIQMPGRRTVSRCSHCGVLLQPTDDPAAKCPKCGFDLHSCKQCSYFDPSSRFECTQPIPERISPKDTRNQCTFYAMRVMVEKETSTPGGPSTPNDARRAFDNLFKD
jgi:predicted RNA-binding Zn-ribbon protein involved in translation (DUF1610 family)